MTCNVGGVDRTLRIIVGLVILGVGFYFSSPLGLIGLVPLGTGIFRWCPLYIPFKFRTCAATDKKS
jgi:hypothetical protein